MSNIVDRLIVMRDKLKTCDESQVIQEHIQELDTILKMYESGKVDDNNRELVESIVEDALKDAEEQFVSLHTENTSVRIG